MIRWHKRWWWRCQFYIITDGQSQSSYATLFIYHERQLFLSRLFIKIQQAVYYFDLAEPHPYVYDCHHGVLFLLMLLQKETHCCVKRLQQLFPFSGFLSSPVSLISVWSRTSLGTMEDWPPALLPFICWTPSFSIWMVKDGMFHSLAHVRKLLFLSFIVKYKSDYRTKRNVERWERCSLKPIKVLLSTRPHSTWSFMQWILIFLQLCL